ncbi:sodium:solute symporter family protein [Pirellulales bacterium]|nr:sodium:solute symporter family protein [Pirellulales bacterium]
MTHGLFLSVFVAYVLVLIGLSLWIARLQRSAEDFLLGNRSIPFFLSLGTTVATLVGTGSSIGAVGQGYANGWRGAMYGVGGGVGLLLLSRFFADVRQHKFVTMSEELSFYYGANRWIKGSVAVFMLLASIGWLGAHILGGSYYLQYAGGLSPTTAKVLLASGFGIYVIIGGYVAVVWTDTIQAIVLFVGFVAMALLAYAKVSALEGAPVYNHRHLDFLRGDNLLPSLSLAVAIMVGVLGTPSYRQRIYSADSPRTVRKSFLASGILYLSFCFVPALIGICAKQLNPTLDNHDHAFLYMARDVLPPALGLFVLIAGLSAAMSSASSDAIAAVSILLRDVYKMFTGRMPDRRHMVASSRWGLVSIILVALAVTLPARDIIKYIKDMIAFVMTGMVVCAFLGKYWPRATWPGGIAALAGGAACTAYFKFDDTLNEFWGGAAVPALATSILAGVAVSLITPPNTISKEEALSILTAERETMESMD